MGVVSSGIGLISGFPIADTVDQLIAVEARPLVSLQQRADKTNAQRTAMLGLSAQLLSLKLTTSKLSRKSSFEARSATSSNESVVKATASNNATVGSFTFSVKQLVQTHQLIGRGFADTDTTTFGATTLRFETGNVSLDRDTPLELLNGQTGVDRGVIRITDRSGAGADIDLSGAMAIQDVLDAINYDGRIDVTASVSGDHLVLQDNTGQTVGDLRVQDVGGNTTAADLGILDRVSSDTLTGQDVVRITADTGLGVLNDGNGVPVRDGMPDFRISLQDGVTSFNVDLSSASKIGDVVTAINTATGNPGTLVASIRADGTGIDLTDTSVGAAALTVTALSDSAAARDLGILGSDTDGNGVLEGRRVLAGLNSVLLRSFNGGSGITTMGTISITDRSNQTVQVDLSSAQTLAEVLSAINSSGVGVTARANRARNGIEIVDTTGASTVDLAVSDVGGSTVAADLNLAGSVASDRIDSGDLDTQYISKRTRLDSLNTGNGIERGKFQITDSSGKAAVVDLTQGNEIALGDVIEEINSRGIGVTARINDTGDGLLLEDTAGGAATLTVTDLSGTSAADLRIAGEDEDNDGKIDGTFERTLEIEATDTLQTLADKINDAGLGVRATIINDGSTFDPYRLSLVSAVGGREGELVIDPGTTGLELSTLVRPRDAVALFGSTAPGSAKVVLTNNTNSITGVVPGLTLDLVSTSATPVTVSVSRDNASVTESLKDFVEDFNTVRSAIDELTAFNPETNQRGLLFGDASLRRIESELYNMVSTVVTRQSGKMRLLAEMGIGVIQSGKLTLDADKATKQLAQDPDRVAKFFVTADTGFAARADARLDYLTRSMDGLIARRSDALQMRVDQYNDRVEHLAKRLANKREQLYSQFIGMEVALARLQSQQSALSQIRSIVAVSS